jgi:YD repeat-containing protein
LNPANGNLVVTLRPPRSGPFDPVPQLTYNSRAADQAIQYGYGWAEVFNPVVSLVSATEVHLINGVGAVHPYRDKDSLGRYLAPAGASNALATVAGGGWVETRPDGFQRRYDSTGSLSRLVSPAGRIWTVQHSGDLVTSIQSPIGTRTTYGYDGSDRLRSIQDSSGRRTTVTINANWDLTEWIRPDGTIITFVYDMSHKLRAIVDPEGHSASYEYDCLRRASSIETPAGDLYTYTYGLANAVIEPSGQRTTLEFDAQRNSQAVINPLGARQTFVWDQGRLVAGVDALGNRTTLAYVTTSSRVEQLEAIVNPLGSRFTFTYNAAGRVQRILGWTGQCDDVDLGCLPKPDGGDRCAGLPAHSHL